MLPIGDRNPTRTTPVVNYVLIALNVAVFLWEYVIMLGGGEAWLVPGYGLVPSRLANDPPGEAFTVLTSMFMHGGWGHLGGNMLFLYIFGDNVEDSVGHGRYLAFYVLAGIGAAAAQIGVDPSSTVPMVGASGAIAGVLGAYMLRFPRAPILAWFVIAVVELPAFVFLFVWFGYQLFMTIGTMGSEAGGVAFAAHAGGFVAGMILDRMLGPSQAAVHRQQAERRARLARLRGQGMAHRRWMKTD